MHVRRARAEDGHGIHVAHTAAIRETCRTHYEPAEIEVWAARTTPRNYDDDMAARDVVVGELDGRIVGFGVLDVHDAEVRAVYVHPAAGRRGVGRRLLDALEALARLRGLSRVCLDSSLNAVPFYAAAGWRREHDTTHTIAEGLAIPCVHMTKRLTALALVVREESPDDAAGVAAVVRAAFARDDEALLVERLRQAGALAFSLVAILDGAVVGHVAFSTVDVDGAAGRVLGLAPLAVTPLYQGCGIGARLVEEGLARARERGVAAAVVLGHGGYYRRFGFDAASRYGIRYRVPVPADAFMAAELMAGALVRATGVVRYRPEFDGL